MRSPASDEFRFSPRPNRAGEIAWRPWDEQTFREAQERGVPILLAISAVWCHWCHVMDETSYSDPNVISILNERFVPLRVDNDRRPDVNRRYNMGGWPTTAFLTETGDLLTGATYLPPRALRRALERIADQYVEGRDDLLSRAARLRQVDSAATREGAVPPSAGFAAAAGDRDAGERRAALQRRTAERLDQEPISWLLAQALDSFDQIHGGFGDAPKFPQADLLAFLLLRAAACRDERVDQVLTTTLDQMATGQLFDHVEHGFFRYATERDWSVPHYEKMLEDNARLLNAYVDAYAVYGQQRYAEVARRIAGFLLGTLWQPQAGAFGGSQDADEHYYGLDAEGRSGLPAPFVDPTIYTDWSALASQALLRAAPMLGQPELAERAVAVLDGLWEQGHGRHGMAHYLLAPADSACPATSPTLTAGPVDGLLGDQSAMLAALLDAYEQTGERIHLARAEVLADWVEDNLTDADGGLLDRLPVADSPGLLARPVPAPSESSQMADALLRLSAYSGEQRYRERAALALAALSSQYQQYGLSAAPYAAALLRYLEPQLHIAVVGDPDAEQTKELLRAAISVRTPLRTVHVLDPAVDPEHALRAGYALDIGPAAYVCLGTSCLPPTSDPAQIAALASGLRADGEQDAKSGCENPSTPGDGR